MSDKAILNKYHEVVPCDELLTWAEWMEKNKRVVAQDQVGPYFISTVFLGLDYSFGFGHPLYFETMVFIENGEAEQFNIERYETYVQANKGHELKVEEVQKYLDSLNAKENPNGKA